jgi:small subunit ribosomal protein S6
LLKRRLSYIGRRFVAAAVAENGYAGSSGISREPMFAQRPSLVLHRSPERDPMALYEHLLIARQDISAQQVDALATHLKTIVEGEGGKVEKQEYWGLRSLAYRIKKNRKGHYVLLNINAPAKAVHELERQLKINEDVLRSMTVKVDQFEQSGSNKRREREAGERKPEAETQEAAQ